MSKDHNETWIQRAKGLLLETITKRTLGWLSNLFL